MKTFNNFDVQKIYDDGFSAYYNNHSDLDNPYEDDSEEYMIWLEGWTDASLNQQ